MQKIGTRISLKKKNYEKYEKQYRKNMSKEDKQKKKE